MTVESASCAYTNQTKMTRVGPFPLDAGGMWLAKVSAQPSVAWAIVPLKYTVPKGAVQMARLKRLMTATVAVSTNLIIRKVALETVTPGAGSTHPGQR